MSGGVAPCLQCCCRSGRFCDVVLFRGISNVCEKGADLVE